MKPQHTGVWLYVPATFDIANFNPQYHRLNNECHWLLHKIASLHAFYRHDGPEFVSISRQTMQQFIHPQDVDVVRDLLLRERVIECDGMFLRGSKSLGYRLAGPYADDIRRVEVTKKSLAAKIQAHRIRWIDRPVAEEEMAQVHQHLLMWLRKTKIDVDAALAIVEDMPDQPKKAAKSKRLGRKSRARAVNSYVQTLNHKLTSRMTIHTIANGDWDWAVCPYGRVHTPVTRLLSETRSCLSIDGQPLVNLDISNSQMIFFALLLMEQRLLDISQRESQSHSRCPSAISSASPTSHKGLSDPSAICPHTHRSTLFLHDLEEDERQFVELVLDGRLYEYLMEKVSEDTTNEETKALAAKRKAFKAQLFRDVFYGDNAAYYSRVSRVAAVFKAQFPAVWDFIVRRKHPLSDEKPEDAYKKLAQLMQLRESQYMINTVCVRLAQHHPEVPVLTIHDSILTTTQHTQTVLRVMREEFVRLGVDPKIRTEQPVGSLAAPTDVRTSTSKTA